MRLWLIGLFLILPIVEIAVIIKVGGLIGLWPTIALMLLSAVVGSALMRQQGGAALADIQRAFTGFRDPTAPLAHGALIVLAGALMVTPGFLTDLTGIALLIPAVRSAILRAAGRHLRVTSARFTTVNMGAPAGPRPDWAGDWTPPRKPQPHRPGGGAVIDAEFVDIDPPAPGTGPRRPSGWTRGTDEPPAH